MKILPNLIFFYFFWGTCFGVLLLFMNFITNLCSCYSSEGKWILTQTDHDITSGKVFEVFESDYSVIGNTSKGTTTINFFWRKLFLTGQSLRIQAVKSYRTSYEIFDQNFIGIDEYNRSDSPREKDITLIVQLCFTYHIYIHTCGTFWWAFMFLIPIDGTMQWYIFGILVTFLFCFCFLLQFVALQWLYPSEHEHKHYGAI